MFSWTFSYSLKNAHEPAHFKHARSFSVTRIISKKPLWSGWPWFRGDCHVDLLSGFELSQRSAMNREAHSENMHTISQPRVCTWDCVGHGGEKLVRLIDTALTESMFFSLYQTYLKRPEVFNLHVHMPAFYLQVPSDRSQPDQYGKQTGS